MPEVDILIRGKDLASDAFAKVEQAGAQAFDTLEQGADRAGSAVDGVTQASEQTGDAQSEVASQFKVSWQQISVAIGAAGAALEAYNRVSARTETVLAQLAIITGQEEEAIRGVAIATAGALDPVSDVTELMLLGAKRGLKSTEDLQTYANFWDTVTTAAGMAGTVLADQGEILAAVGIKVGEESKALSAFGFVAANTAGGIQGLMSVIQRGGPYLSDLGLSVDDVAAALGSLESRGISGRAQMRMLNEAFTKSEGNTAAFWKILGITNEELGVYKKRIEASSNVAQQLNDAEDEHITRLQRLTNLVQNYATKYGPLLSSMSDLSPILLGVAGSIAAVGAAWPMISAVFPGVAAAATAAGAAISTSILPAIGILAAVAAAGYVLYKAWTENWGGIQEITKQVVDMIGRDVGAAFQTVVADVTAAGRAIWEAIGPTIEQLQELFQAMAPVILPIVQALMQGIYELTTVAMGGVYNRVKENVELIWSIWQWLGKIVGPFLQTVIGGWILLFQNLPNLPELVSDAFEGLLIYIQEFGAKMLESGKGLIATFTEGIKSAAMMPVQAIADILNRVRAYLPGSDADTGPLSDLTASGTGMMLALADGVDKGAPVLEGAVNRAVSRAHKAIGKPIAPTFEKEGDEDTKNVWARNEEERKAAEELRKQREFDSQDRLTQLQTQYAEELRMMEQNGQDTTATRLYYANLIAEEEARLREEQILAEQTMMQARADVAGSFAELMQMMFEQSGEQARTFFELMKAASIAEAIINAHLAATKALAEIPWPLNIAMAAIIYGKAMMQVAQIASQEIAMAEGGIVTGPTRALIGEAGPEAVIPLDRLAMGSPTIINVEIIGGIWTTRPETAQELARYIRPYLDREYAR